jgi:lipoprotein-anchoring transpeptidase ErfK/SrfK
MSRKIQSLTLVLALFLSVIGGLMGPHNVLAARLAGLLLFTAPGRRAVSAGQTQKVWVHTMAQAEVTLTVDYGNGQRLTQHGTTDKRGMYLFRWTVGYTGFVVVLAHYWVYVARDHLSTATRGNFVLFPAPPLQVHLEILTPSLNVGDTLRVRVHSRPGARLSLSVGRADGSRLLRRSARADGTGDWLVSAPVSATVTRQQRLRIVVNGYDLGRHASAVGVLTLWPRPVLWNTITPGSPIPAAHPTSLDAARRSARAAAAGSLAAAESNARTAVQAITVDLQVLAQWTTAAPPHSVTYYQDLLARANSYDAFITVTAQALADNVQVEARMHAVMPPKAIMVSVAEQALRAYQDGRLVLFTYVTTGRPELPTVTGHFYIYEKVTPWQFTSPWPPGSPYYYPPSWIKYWMPFYSGYGLHDAWWRQHYGPGTNVYGDGPGSGEPTGTHGCVNIPFAQTQWLWNWAPVGTSVVVYGGPSVTPGVAGI